MLEEMRCAEEKRTPHFTYRLKIGLVSCESAEKEASGQLKDWSRRVATDCPQNATHLEVSVISVRREEPTGVGENVEAATRRKRRGCDLHPIPDIYAPAGAYGGRRWLNDSAVDWPKFRAARQHTQRASRASNMTIEDSSTEPLTALNLAEMKVVVT